MNIFERAARNKLRFASSKGELTVENLWDLPLTGKVLDLDTLARETNRELKSIEEGSFVNVAPDPRKSLLELKLDILKHIIQAKLEDQARAIKAKETADRRRKLLEVLEKKEEGELSGLTKEQIQAELERLGGG